MSFGGAVLPQADRHPDALPTAELRRAAANGLRPAELFRIVQPGSDRNPRDLDRHADIPLLDLLTERTGLERDKLALATFRRWAGTVFSHDDGLNKMPWLPPAGREGGRRCFGQQLCPWCLQADPQPYLRLIWRLSFVTVCPVHGRLLLDRCPICSEPFGVLRMDRVQEMRCQSCATDLRTFAADAPLVDTVPVQKELLRTIGLGWSEMGTYGPVYSFAALDILALITRLLSGGRHAHALRGWVSSHADGLAVAPETIPRAREGALLGARARNVLVPMAHWLMSDWPHRFVAAAKSIGMTGRDICKRPDRDYPFAFAHAIEWHLKLPEKRGNRDEVLAAKEALRSQVGSVARRDLVNCFGTKRRTFSELADLVAPDTAPWGKGRYWKLDGVSPEVKEAARSAAHRAGEGVGPWLDALLRRELGMPARKTPCARPSPDTFAVDGVSGCAK